MKSSRKHMPADWIAEGIETQVPVPAEVYRLADKVHQARKAAKTKANKRQPTC